MTLDKFIVPEKMHAIEIKEFGVAENLKPCLRPVPRLLNNQVLIKVSYALL